MKCIELKHFLILIYLNPSVVHSHENENWCSRTGNCHLSGCARGRRDNFLSSGEIYELDHFAHPQSPNIRMKTPKKRPRVWRVILFFLFLRQHELKSSLMLHYLCEPYRIIISENCGKPCPFVERGGGKSLHRGKFGFWDTSAFLMLTQSDGGGASKSWQEMGGASKDLWWKRESVNQLFMRRWTTLVQCVGVCDCSSLVMWGQLRMDVRLWSHGHCTAPEIEYVKCSCRGNDLTAVSLSRSRG